MFLPTHHHFLGALYIYGSHRISGAPCIPFETRMLADSVAGVQTHETIHIYEETCAGAQVSAKAQVESTYLYQKPKK